ncbi:MAG: hypothetical protein ABIQ74_12680 [Chitinophagales bacterium]
MDTLQLKKETENRTGKTAVNTIDGNENIYQHSTLQVLFGGNRFYILATFILFLLLDGTALIAVAGNQ